MLRRYDASIETEITACASLAENWFRVRFSNREAFEVRLRAGLRFMGQDQNEENKISLTKHMGLFSLELFQAMISGGESFSPRAVSIVWDRLLDSGLALRALPFMKGTPFADHQIVDALLLGQLQDNTFANLFAQPARLLDRYRHAVAAVDVAKNEDLSRGSGFVVISNHRQYFVTCKHNVDPDDGISLKAVTSSHGEPIQLGKITQSEQFDVAVAPLTMEIAGPCFVLSDVVEVFDEVFTLGYPLVPGAHSVLVGHRGEVNGQASLYSDSCPILLISNLVSPGSSGGPVLSRDGHCVGMTIRWLEAEWGDAGKTEKTRFSAALPAEILRNYIQSL